MWFGRYCSKFFAKEIDLHKRFSGTVLFYFRNFKSKVLEISTFIYEPKAVHNSFKPSFTLDNN